MHKFNIGEIEVVIATDVQMHYNGRPYNRMRFIRSEINNDEKFVKVIGGTPERSCYQGTGAVMTKIGNVTIRDDGDVDHHVKIRTPHHSNLTLRKIRETYNDDKKLVNQFKEDLTQFRVD